ncbi:MAG: Mut7-C RNAse domain-containing protein [Candidatus Latescibacterota bacterium]
MGPSYPRRNEAQFRFYEELNDFLPPERRRCSFPYSFTGTPSVKDAVEALGVPHAEVDLILVDGRSVGFGHRLRGGERVAVYPVFESLDISPVVRLRPRPLRHTRFVLDVHLGKLARHLRLLGFDVLYRNDLEDAEIVALSVAERRLILTRDRGLLKHSAVTHGYWLRQTRPSEQLREVVERFDLAGSARPFSRCVRCNGELQPVAAESLLEVLPPRVRREQAGFARCGACGRVFWRGTHYQRLLNLVAAVVKAPDSGSSE